MEFNNFRDLPKLKPDNVKRKRISSYDKKFGNRDWIDVKPNETIILAKDEAVGKITHIWCTCACRSKHYLRNAIIRMYWDGENEDTPSVEAPIGDFFGMGHAEKANFNSLPLQMSPQSGKGFNCWFPMPFSKSFKITLENDNEKNFRIYFYIDYEIYEQEEKSTYKEKFSSLGRFHAQWRRENPTKPKVKDNITKEKFSRLNPLKFNFLGGRNANPLIENYVVLEAKGKGHYVGCNINIDNITFLPFVNWPGEGDDMIFIDDDVEEGTATLQGTGTEDYVNQAFCPREKYSSLFHGTIKPGGFNWWGKITYYRYHILDPVYFNERIVVTIEHGHDNHRKDDWSSTAYWYQKEPHDHSLYPELKDRKGRKPRTHLVHKLRKGAFFVLIFVVIYLVILRPLLTIFL